MTEPNETGITLIPSRRKLGRGLGALMGEMRRDEPIIRLNPHAPHILGDPAEAVSASPQSVNNALKHCLSRQFHRFRGSPARISTRVRSPNSPNRSGSAA